MPTPVVPIIPYPTAEQVMNRARAIVNDSFLGGKGRILTDQAPFSEEYLNSALEELQDKIRNNGVITLIHDNVILTPITALPAVNPAVQIYIAYQGFFNGSTWVDTPKLPADLRVVDFVWERQLGSGLPFQPMTQPREGLCSAMQGQWFGQWEYRQDRICMIGSTVDEELRIRYTGMLAPITASTTENPWSNVSIGILASINALAHLVAYAYARARGAAQAAVLAADADKHMKYITNTYTRRAQGVDYRRQPYGSEAGADTIRLPF